jgi:hypothetical protein
MRFSSHFERSEAESRNLFFNRFLHFGPLCGPPVEITKAHILIIIGIICFLACQIFSDVFKLDVCGFNCKAFSCIDENPSLMDRWLSMT